MDTFEPARAVSSRRKCLRVLPPAGAWPLWLRLLQTITAGIAVGIALPIVTAAIPVSSPAFLVPYTLIPAAGLSIARFLLAVFGARYAHAHWRGRSSGKLERHYRFYWYYARGVWVLMGLNVALAACYIAFVLAKQYRLQAQGYGAVTALVSFFLASEALEMPLLVWFATRSYPRRDTYNEKRWKSEKAAKKAARKERKDAERQQKEAVRQRDLERRQEEQEQEQERDSRRRRRIKEEEEEDRRERERYEQQQRRRRRRREAERSRRKAESSREDRGRRRRGRDDGAYSDGERESLDSQGAVIKVDFGPRRPSRTYESKSSRRR